MLSLCPQTGKCFCPHLSHLSPCLEYRALSPLVVPKAEPVAIALSHTDLLGKPRQT